MFISDRDVLALEPNIFREAGWVGQRLLSVTGSVSGTSLTITSGDLQAVGIGTGHVIIYDALALEVLSVESAGGATVSLLRARSTDPAIPVPALGVKSVACWSFGPQISLVHAQVLRMLGIDPDEPPGDMVTEASIVNPSSLTLVEAVGTLHMVYSAAAALSAADTALAARAQMYRQRFGEERQRAVVKIDLDGDGEADASRRLNLLQFVRA